MRRPHPAHRARVVTGVVSVSVAIGLTGGFLVESAATATGVEQAVSTKTTTTLSATPSTPATQATTSSHGS